MSNTTNITGESKLFMCLTAVLNRENQYLNSTAGQCVYKMVKWLNAQHFKLAEKTGEDPDI